MQDGVLNLCRVKLRDQQRLKARPAEGVHPVRQGHRIRRSDATRAATILAAASQAPF
jgi:hypothetical protein